MAKQLGTKSDVLLENITLSIRHYKKSKNQKNIEKIKKYLMTIFDVQYVLLWQYNIAKNRLLLLDKTNIELDIGASLIKDVIQKKRPQIENHIISHKSYEAKIDNPFEYHIKSMMITPLLEDGVVKGILVLAKDMQQRRVFERKEILRIKKFQIALLPLMKSYRTVSSLNKKNKDVVFKIFEVEKKDTEPEYDVLAKVENETVDTSLVEEKEIVTTNETMVKTVVEQKDEKLQLEMIALKEEIVYLKTKNELTIEMEAANKRYLEVIEKMTIAQNISEKQVGYLEKKIKNLENNKLIVNEQSEKNLQLSKIPIESLLMQTLPNLVRCEQLYILYEFIMYELQGSSTRVHEIENKIKKSKLVYELLEETQYGCMVPLNEKFINMRLFMMKLDSLQEKFLIDRLNVEITLHSAVPIMLKIDMEKVLNLCLHLMSDITQFIDVHKPLKVDFDYIDNLLHVFIKGVKHESLDRLLNKKKFTSSLKERTALAMSKKLVEILSVDLESYMEEIYCIHQLVIPAK